MIYLRAAMAALSAAGLLTKLLVAAGLVASVLAAYGVWHHKVYQAGYDRAIADIARDDKRAVGRANKLRDGYEACTGRGAVWDQITGTCR